MPGAADGRRGVAGRPSGGLRPGAGAGQLRDPAGQPRPRLLARRSRLASDRHCTPRRPRRCTTAILDECFGQCTCVVDDAAMPRPHCGRQHRRRPMQAPASRCGHSALGRRIRSASAALTRVQPDDPDVAVALVRKEAAEPRKHSRGPRLRTCESRAEREVGRGRPAGGHVHEVFEASSRAFPITSNPTRRELATQRDARLTYARAST